MQSKTKARKVPPISKAQFPEGWAFVNLSEPEQSKDKRLRKFVRANAMRDYRQKKKQNEIEHQRQPGHITARHEVSDISPLPKSDLSTPIQNDDGDDRCFISCGHPCCVDGCRYSSTRARSSPKQLLGDGGIDPFDTSPMEGDRQYKGYVLNHFITVIAHNCFPVEPGRGQHPLTNIWMPYAVADPLLFLATTNYAAAHLDIMYGRQNNLRTLAQKAETIRLINLRLQDSAETLSNSTIGAVAMLAAAETTTSSSTGIYHDMSVHMDALEKMVRMRGGLQQLGWDGVLQMFISWQDLLSSAILSTPPHFPRLPVCLTIQGEIPASSPICPELGTSTGFCAEMINSFNDMRQLTHLVSSFDHSATLIELMSPESVRSSIPHRLLSLQIRKPKQRMQYLDYLLEACRIAALIFLKRVFHSYWPRCKVIMQLRGQLKELLLEKEGRIIQEVHPQPQQVYYTWALLIGGIHSLNDEDTAFFAKRIAISTRVWQAKGFGGWPEILSRIKRVSWANALQSPECDLLGEQVERFIRSGDGVWDLTPIL